MMSVLESDRKRVLVPKQMDFLREICPTSEEISPGVYNGTCVETAFLISYPLAKREHPNERISIVMGEEHCILQVGNHTTYDPIDDALRSHDPNFQRTEDWKNAITVAEEDFSEWWTVNILAGKYHPSADFIADLA